jgi:lysophospholipase L1-like esterase
MTSAAESAAGAGVRRAARVLCGGSFALSAALALRLSGEGCGYVAAAAGLVALGALGVVLAGRRRARGPALALAALNLALVVPELGLRSAGFRHVSGIQFGFPEPEEFWELELDPELFWKLPHAPPLTNSLGFFGPEPRRAVPSGTVRLLVLGDSCAQQGYPLAWPELASAMLSERTGREVDEVNLALSGYSSHQGRVLADRHAAELAPDLALVAFGWNDHWLARGAADADKRVDLRFEGLYRRFRLLQLVRRARDALAPPDDAPRPGRPRVPREDFRANLRAMVERLRAAGAAVVLATMPTTHDLELPEYLVEQGFVAGREGALELHRAYNRDVREVAAESGAVLWDLERELEGRPDREELFLPDGIHFTEAGRLAVAKSFAELARGLPPFR